MLYPITLSKEILKHRFYKPMTTKKPNEKPNKKSSKIQQNKNQQNKNQQKQVIKVKK